MTPARPSTAALLALTLLLAGLAALSPSVLASDECAGTKYCDCTKNNGNWDVEPDGDGWIRAPHPAAGPLSASKALRMQLIEHEGGPALGPHEVYETVNGIDAYVHDFGCETTETLIENEPMTFCLASIPGSTGDRQDDLPGLFDVYEAPELLDRDDDWRIQFFGRQPGRLNPTPVGPPVEVADSTGTGGCPQSGSRVDGDVPVDARYAVIWLDSSDLAEPDRRDPDAAENLVPRGVQTRSMPPGSYAAHFEFDVCVNQQTGTGGCD